MVEMGWCCVTITAWQSVSHGKATSTWRDPPISLPPPSQRSVRRLDYVIFLITNERGNVSKCKNAHSTNTVHQRWENLKYFTSMLKLLIVEHNYSVTSQKFVLSRCHFNHRWTTTHSLYTGYYKKSESPSDFSLSSNLLKVRLIILSKLLIHW